MRGGNVFRRFGGVWMRAGDATDIGSELLEMVVDNGETKFVSLRARVSPQ